MASGHQDRIQAREPSGGRGARVSGTPARRSITTSRGRQVPTAAQSQGTEGRSGDSQDRGQGGWFSRRVMGQPGK